MYAPLTDAAPQPYQTEWQPGELQSPVLLGPISNTYPPDALRRSESARELEYLQSVIVLTPIPQPIVLFVTLRPDPRTTGRDTRSLRTYTLAEAGMTREEAAAFRGRLGAFAEGWDDGPADSAL